MHPKEENRFYLEKDHCAYFKQKLPQFGLRVVSNIFAWTSTLTPTFNITEHEIAEEPIVLHEVQLAEKCKCEQPLRLIAPTATSPSVGFYTSSVASAETAWNFVTL